MLCSLGNFDAYTVSRDHPSPKPYVFALRSTDSPSMFEDASDSVHVFSCEKGEGERWVEIVMLARVRTSSGLLIIYSATNLGYYPAVVHSPARTLCSLPWPVTNSSSFTSRPKPPLNCTLNIRTSSWPRTIRHHLETP